MNRTDHGTSRLLPPASPPSDPRRAARRTARLVACALLALGYQGCGEQRAGQDSLTVPRLAYERTIGNPLDPNDTLAFVPIDIVAHGDRILLADAVGQIRVADRSGRIVRVIGRPGGGPGEFTDIRGTDVSKEGIVAAADLPAGRISLFDLGGNLVGEFRTVPPPRTVAFDALGRLHVGHSGPVTDDSSPGQAIVGVYLRSGRRVAVYGTYEHQPEPLADAMNNEVRFAAGPDGDMWALYTYRGMVEHWSADGELLHRFALPPPKGRPAGGPFVRQLQGRDDVLAIVRLPVATDIALGGDATRPLLYALAVQVDERMRRYSELLVLSDEGSLLASYPLRRHTSKIALWNDELFALHDRGPEAPAVDVYSIERPSHVGSKPAP